MSFLVVTLEPETLESKSKKLQRLRL